ncbi:MAG: YckD family protein, partial [Firmicutes bacterium]|nr:YckD family protein [Bacillota bacterium]
MTKKITIGLIVTAVVLTLLVSSVVLAQESDATLEALYEQIYELQRQVVQRRVELGNLTEEEGNRMLTLMEERFLEDRDEGSGGFSG